MRHPKTIRERRDSLNVENGVHVRAKRNNANLPNDYDDVCVKAQNSWKKHRLTRWRTAKTI